MIEKYCLGLDIGGSTIKVGVCDKSGNVKLKFSHKTAVFQGNDAFVSSVIAAAREAFSRLDFELSAIGVGVPGYVDEERGVVVYSGNLEVTKVELKKILEKEFGVPCFVGNDANVAALGEVCYGSARGLKNAVMVTLGTGVGSGIIINGKIYSGNGSAGAEVGHMIIHPNGECCTCGARGCFEAYASATALVRITKEHMKADLSSKLWQIGMDKIDAISAFKLQNEDACAKKAVDEYILNLSVGLINIANIFRPQVIIIGGGVSHEGDNLIKPLLALYKNGLFAKGLAPDVPLALASLGNDAGFMGAVALCNN